jgi:hypothetical protein
LVDRLKNIRHRHLQDVRAPITLQKTRLGRDNMTRHTYAAGALVLTAMLALIAVDAGAALAGLAPRWKVNGAFAGAAVSVEAEGVSTTEALLRTPLFTLKAAVGECKLAGKVVGSAVETPGTFKEGTLTCANTKVEGAEEAVCTVGKAGTVTSEKLKGTLVWLEAAKERAGIDFVPEMGAKFANIAIAGAGCKIAGTYAVTGEIVGEWKPEAANVKEAELEFPKVPKANCSAENVISSWWNNALPRVKQGVGGLVVGGGEANLCLTAKVSAKKKEDSLGVFAG